jgi:hypothetical protein
MGTSRKASEPIQEVNAELLEAVKRARRYVADLPIVGDADLAVIDAAISKATATRNSGDEG